MKDTKRLYDNGGKTIDRYTLVHMDQPEGGGLYACFGFSEDPFHPLGFGQHGAAMPGRHLGKRITPDELPPQARKAYELEITQ